MGLFDSIVKNITRNVVEDTVRHVEFDASRRMADKVEGAFGKAADKTKASIQQKAVEAEKAIDKSAEEFRDNAQIKKNTDKSDTMNFATKKKVSYRCNTANVKGTFYYNVIGNFTFNNEKCGPREGDMHLATVLSDAIFTELNAVLAEYTDQGVPADQLKGRMIAITKSVNERMNGICEQNNIFQHSLLFLTFKLTDEDQRRYDQLAGNNLENFGGAPAAAAMPSWTCEYCGTHATGDNCPGCGASRQ